MPLRGYAATRLRGYAGAVVAPWCAAPLRLPLLAIWQLLPIDAGVHCRSVAVPLPQCRLCRQPGGQQPARAGGPAGLAPARPRPGPFLRVAGVQACKAVGLAP